MLSIIDNIVDVKNLRTVFGDIIVHNNMNFSLARNKLTVLAGNSGSGKTSVINFMTGESHQSSGEIFINGDLSNAHDLIKKISLAPQRGGLLRNYNVIDNIMFAIQAKYNVDDNVAKEIASVYCRSVSLNNDTLCKYPDELSGGMLRRAVLARSIATQNEIIILDEPLAGLDYENIRKISLLIRQIKNATVLCITHIPIVADVYLFLHEGKIYEVQRALFAQGVHSKYPADVLKMARYFLDYGR